MIDDVIKFDGRVEPFIAEKVMGWGKWGARGYSKYIDWMKIVTKTVAQLSGTVHTRDIAATMIRNCLDEDTWAGQLMAGRIYADQCHKEVWGSKTPKTLKAIHDVMIGAHVMVKLNYSDEEYARIEKWINHKRDYDCAWYQLAQGRDKYALRNRLTGRIYETRQHALMRVAMVICEPHDPILRMDRLKSMFADLSEERMSAPTPNHNNMGTGHNGFFSCCLFTCDDTKESIAAASHIAEVMTYMSAGLGENMQVRSLKDPIRGGGIVHSGKLPYYNKQTGIVKSNKQGSRGGSLTEYFSAYDPEVQTIMALKNPRTPLNKRNRAIDYCMMLNRFLLWKSSNEQDVFLFNCFTAPDLYEAMYGKDLKAFVDLYDQYEADPTFKKVYISARSIVVQAKAEGFETGRFYQAMIDTINFHTPHRDKIYSSNLCVAPETMLLTDKGHQVISLLEGQTVNVWNGQEWSETSVVKTGTNQALVTVALSDGRKLDCTLYHKFYVQKEYGKDPVEVRAHELQPGDKLIKMSLPVIEGTEYLEEGYRNGFYSGDGTRLNATTGRIYLYGAKRELASILDDTRVWRDNGSRLELEFKGLREKYFVPNAKYTLACRLEWLAGILDSDGCVYRNGGNEALTLSSNKWHFLCDIQDMLQEMGIASKISEMYPAGERSMPLNDGSGEYGRFDCKATYRLLISSSASQKLLELGLVTRRLDIGKRAVQREAEQFAVVIGVADHGRVDDTYCVTEPKRHMAVFNGILTGQCVEITQPTYWYKDVMQLYSTQFISYIKFATPDRQTRMLDGNSVVYMERVQGPVAAIELKAGDVYWTDKDPVKRPVVGVLEAEREPEVSLCALGAIIVTNCETEDQYAEATYNLYFMIDFCIDHNHYALPHMALTAKARRNAGVGMMDVAHHMARKGLKYDTVEGLEELHRVAERHMYHCIQASIRLAKERGNAEWIHKTDWVRGWTPMQTYSKAVDGLGNFVNQYDWDQVSRDLIAVGGGRFSSLVAWMPGESSSKYSAATNSYFGLRYLSITKKDGSNSLEWVAPEADTLKDQYTFMFQMTRRWQINVLAVIQKWTDQAVSADFYSSIKGNDKVSSLEMIEETNYFADMGCKTWYYTNVETSDTDALSGVTERKGMTEIAGLEDDDGLDLAGPVCTSGGCTM